VLDAELVEEQRGFLHGAPVRTAAHDDTDDGWGFFRLFGFHWIQNAEIALGFSTWQSGMGRFCP